MNKRVLKLALTSQKNEITSYKIYTKFANKIKDKKNKNLLHQIAKDEIKHYDFWKKITKKDVKSNKLMIFIYSLLTNIFGLSFGLKLMEKGELKDYANYKELKKEFPGVENIIKDEKKHEFTILGLLSDKRLEYASSVVLGLNDALVELTGALTGLTLALQDRFIVAVAGLVTGIAAALSMAASSYLSSREDENRNKRKQPITSALTTGITYIITVLLLIIPYFIFNSITLSLIFMLIIGILIIAAYTFYISTAKSISFFKRFVEMATISIGVAAISFGIGLIIRFVLGIEI